ncbi:hypothetical protein ACHAXA_010531 [Cyclostephanos tholiformis]|jgi:hypothetical protein|uniref:Uncharacterized protein n=1 Tax=Cyclostephanos tholiformis TaxID=382380 RepID=A0ABD3SQH5_9STRA
MGAELTHFHSNPLSLQLVASEYSKLQGAIDDLGTSIGSTLSRQKQDLERAYSSEISKVQAEIEILTNDKSRLEESIMTNERACQLQIERDWYKKEALHLDEVLEKMKVRQREIFESEHDREWMKRQMRKLAKKNAILERKLKEVGIDVSSLLARELADAENDESRGEDMDSAGKSVSVSADSKGDAKTE